MWVCVFTQTIFAEKVSSPQHKPAVQSRHRFAYLSAREETHDAFSASSAVADLLTLVPSDLVGAVWDSHHPHRVGETPAAVYANLGPRVLLAQVKDARQPDRATMASTRGGVTAPPRRAKLWVTP